MKLVPFCLLLAALLLPTVTALKCYTGYSNGGDEATVTTCREEETHCLLIRHPRSVIQECKTAKKCEEVREEAAAIGFPAKCCSEDLCNRA